MTARGPDMPASTSEAVTRGIRVHVDAAYAPQHSHPSQQKWVFVYSVRITNESAGRVQLLSRQWIITDATGRMEEVRGDGVIGQQPVIDPGESFDRHLRLPARDAVRLDERHLRDAGPRRRAVCRGDCALQPRRAVQRALIVAVASAHSSGRCRIRQSSTMRPPIRCSWMMRSRTGGSHPRYHAPSG